MKKVILREISRCSTYEQESVREVRNQETIRQYMYTDHLIDREEHITWLAHITADPKKMTFVVFLNDVVSGLVSLSNIDKLHGSSDWAFYLDQATRGGLGSALEYALLNFVFDTLELQKLNCEVIETNAAVVALHKRFGFQEEGLRRSNIEKKGKRLGVYLLGITKEDWSSRRATIRTSYQALLDRFEIEWEK